MKIANYTINAILVMVIAILITCSKEDDYTRLLNGKEVVYSGKADSVVVHSGRNRIAISWFLLSDPKITKTVIYWNNSKDSLVVPITRTAGVDSISVIIPNLKIGVYNFVIYTYDKVNNRSVPVYATGRVFGSDYEKSLINRSVNSAYRWTNEVPMFIAWGKLDNNNVAVGAKIMYKDSNGKPYTEAVSFKSSSDTSMLILPKNVNPGAVVEFITMIKPDKLALDTFYAPKEKLIYSQVAVNALAIKESVSGVVEALPENCAIDKVNLTFTKAINITRLSLDSKMAYTADVQINTSDLPGGTTAMNLSDVTMTTANGTPTTQLIVPAGKSTIQLNFKMPKSMLVANTGKKMAFNVSFSNLATSRFNVSGTFLTASIVVDEKQFLKINDITTTYFKNPGGSAPFFIRTDAGSTDRWGYAKDWIATPNVYTVGGKGGIDTPNGNNYLNFFKWSSTAAILDGKLYQTFKLPAGKFEFKIDLNDASETIGSGGSAIYYVVADGNTLPDKSNVASSIAYAMYTNGGVKFELSSSKTVSIGLLAYLNNGDQEYRARGVKLYQYVDAFE